MKSKIGLAIVTYTINYGTFLQAFATQRILQTLGYNTEIINIDGVIDDISKRRKKYFLKQIFNYSEVMSYRHTILSIIAKKVDKTYKDYFAQRERCFIEFKNRYFNIGEKICSWSALSEHCNEFSSVLVGSDQLWRPANIAGDFYTLNFVPDHINKVSYATSFGLKEVRKSQETFAKNFLNRITHLSCREKSGADIILKLTGRQASVVCDPTMLLQKKDWESFLPERQITGEYVFVYLLGGCKKHREFVKKLARENSCKVVGILHGAGYIYNDEKNVDEAPAAVDPFAFLSLIKHAKYVVTDSFHGCVFSTIFEKNFFALKRFSDKDKMSTNSRITNYLSRMKLSDRLVEDFDHIPHYPINYNEVGKEIDTFRAESLQYLQRALQ